MSRAIHDRKSLHAAIDALPASFIEKGVILYAPRVEMEFKKKHPQRRFVLTGDDDLMAGFYEQRDRYITILVNKAHALEALLALWRAPTDEQIANWRHES